MHRLCTSAGIPSLRALHRLPLLSVFVLLPPYGTISSNRRDAASSSEDLIRGPFIQIINAGDAIKSERVAIMVNMRMLGSTLRPAVAPQNLYWLLLFLLMHPVVIYSLHSYIVDV